MGTGRSGVPSAGDCGVAARREVPWLPSDPWSRSPILGVVGVDLCNKMGSLQTQILRVSMGVVSQLTQITRSPK